MNAGAHGTETRERMVELTAIDRDGNTCPVQHEMGYAYRHSDARLSKDLIFTSAVFEGVLRTRPTVRQEMADVVAHREKAQPIREKTGGSTFKNPPGTSAWKEVDAAGCRGLAVGGAQMSENALQFHDQHRQCHGSRPGAPWRNRAGAGALKHSGIRLEWEIKRLGAFGPQGAIEPFLGEKGRLRRWPRNTLPFLMGGWVNERPVSLTSGQECAAALEEAGYKVTKVRCRPECLGSSGEIEAGCGLQRAARSLW